MRDKLALSAAWPARLIPASIPALLDRAAFGLLLALGVCFAVEFRQPLINLGVMVLSNVEALMALMLLAWIASRLVAGKFPRIPQPLLYPIIAWISILVLSALLAPDDQRKSFLFLGRVIGGVLVGWAAFDVINTPRRLRFMLSALALGGLLVAIIGLLEATQLSGILRWLLSFKAAPTQVGEVTRISSTLSYATIAAMVLELTLPLMLALWITSSQKWVRIALGAGIVITLAALVLTLSRAGVLAMLAALLVVVAYAVSQKQRLLGLAAIGTGALLLILVVAVMFWNPTTMLRLSTETEQKWYRASYQVPATLTVRPRSVSQIPVTVTNTSVRAWSASGDQPFMLSYHLLDEDGATVSYDGARTALPHDIQPGEQITLDAVVAAPDEVGTYALEWDMLQNDIAWFSWKGTPIASMTLTVEGAPAEGESISQTARPTDIHIVAPAPTRFELWAAALRMAQRYPLLGVGPDNFRWQYGRFAGLDLWNTDIHANNLYLEWLADTGVLGLAVFLWLSAMLVMTTIRGIRASQAPLAILGVGLLASLAAWYVHGLFDAFIEFTPTYVAFWLIAGLAVSLLRGDPRNANRV